MPYSPAGVDIPLGLSNGRNTLSREVCLRQDGRKERKSSSFLERVLHFRLQGDSLVSEKDSVSPFEK